MTCKLNDPKLILAPHDPGEPPAWVPLTSGTTCVWVDRVLFDALKARRYDKPCDICPDEIKERCDEYEPI